MALTNKLKPLLHPKAWEMRTPAPAANAAGSFVVAADMNTQMSRVFEVDGVSAIYAYYGQEDAWVQLPNSGLGGTFGAGTATAGDKIAIIDYTDGSEFNFLYWRRSSGTEMFRIGEIK